MAMAIICIRQEKLAAVGQTMSELRQPITREINTNDCPLKAGNWKQKRLPILQTKKPNFNLYSPK